jgi:hypothetical protein
VMGRRTALVLCALAAVALAGCGRPVTTRHAPAVPARPGPALPWGAREANKYLPDDVLIADAANDRIRAAPVELPGNGY